MADLYRRLIDAAADRVASRCWFPADGWEFTERLLARFRNRYGRTLYPASWEKEMACTG